MHKRLDKLEIRLYNRGTTLGLQHLYKVTLETRPKLTALFQKISESITSLQLKPLQNVYALVYIGGVGGGLLPP